MDQGARNQYLRDLREAYQRARKKVKTALLEEAEKRTRLHRKVSIRKLSHPRSVVAKPRGKRKPYYDGAVQYRPL
jgi:hypothetical protein